MKKGIQLAKKIMIILGTVLTVVMMVLATVVHFSVRWMFDTWSNLTMDELVFHLMAPLEGTNEAMIREYLNMCIVPAVLMLILAVILFVTWHKKKIYFAFMGVGMAASLVVSVKVVRGAWDKLDVGDYVESQGEYSTFIDDNYVNPMDVTLSFPEKKRNLIYIFLESMETTFADEENGGAFEENVIQELTALAQENEDFSGESEKINGGYAMPGTGWTMGAMFAQTSGLPLNISIDENSMDTQDSFFPNIATMGDILEDAGYSQTLMIGSNAVFGGRKLYFSEHGDYEFIDYNYAQETEMIPEGYRVWWGYEDQKLFEFAKDKVLELAANEEAFNLTLLTVDTHFEDGYLCPLCPDLFRNDQYSNVMACASRQVYEFIEWIQRQDFYENTTIVLVGDHPTMDSDFCDDIDKSYRRRVYTSFINSAVSAETNYERSYTTFDIFPTTLAALGVGIEGERLGLGTNLFSSKQTLTERFGLENEKREIKKKSALMEEMASLDENKQELLIREGKEPQADVTIEAYDGVNGILPVRVSDFENISNGVADVMLGVWVEEDQSDFQWVQMDIQEDSTYFAGIAIANFEYKVGDYHIRAYVVDGAGEQYQVEETVGIVN